MEFIVEFLKDINVLLIVVSALFILLAIAGGIQTRWFKLNTSKMWQRISLLIFGLVFLFGGIFPLISPKPLPSLPLRDMLLERDGKFEWQWAGQNWIGYVVFTENAEKQIKAEIDVHKIFKRQKDGEQTIVTGPQVLKSIERGNIIPHKDHIELNNLVVRKNTFRWIKATPDIKIEGIEVEGSSTEILSASNLQPVPAFAGRVKYKKLTGEGGESEGDMVLVKYKFGVYPSE